MQLKKYLRMILPNFILNFLDIDCKLEKFAFANTLNVKKDIETKYGFNGDLLDIFTKNKGQVVYKWHHYIPIYDRHFSNLRMKKIKFLEIGVFKGGSLQIWRKYFGYDAVIYGIDIDPNCAKYNGIAGQVRVGSQNNLKFLETVINEMGGGADVILDDGSHQMADILKTFKFLFPKLNDGGIYVIEDLHTAYIRHYGGGYYSKSNFFKFVSELINDMHHWYHSVDLKHPTISSSCSSIHIYDSIVVFEKSVIHKPSHSQIS